MVTTRNHPKGDFEATPTDSPANPSPTKRATRSSTANSTKASSSPPPTPTRNRTSTSTTSSSSRRRSDWSHTPSNLTLIWLAISLPLVIWDTGYVLLRPHSMPGGFLHKPIWQPYELYGTVDKVYGLEAWETHNGWTAAQGSVNALETVAYMVYLYIVYKYGEQEPVQGRGAPERSVMGQLRGLSESRTVSGRVAAVAVVLAYTTATVTFWKTILYWLLEAFGGFHSIGHNSFARLLFLWIIPNGAWIIFPLYMIYVFGSEILQGLESSTSGKSR